MPAIIEQRRQQDYERYYRVEFERVWQDETTWVAETLNAPLEKERIYHLENGELFSEEGVALKEVFEDSIKHYEGMAFADSSKKFLHERALTELDELSEMTYMAHGAGTNTMVVFSTYPEELKGAVADVEGYKHKQKTGFIRIIRRRPDSSLSMWTHTFDSDDKDGIRAMYAYLGHSLDEMKDPLAQRIRLDLAEDYEIEGELLGDSLLYSYDKTLHDKYGEKYFAGRSERDRREAVQFVEGQSDLVRAHVDFTVKHGRKSERMRQQRYNFAIAMKHRFEGKQFIADSTSGEMSGAGDIGRANGDTVSGCGLTIDMPSQNTTQSLQEAGYKVEKPKPGLDKCMQCPKCEERGVRVHARGGERYYTCESENGCGVTTLPGAGRGRQDGDKASTAAKPVGELFTKPDKRSLARARYGEHAEVRTIQQVGSAYIQVFDRRTDEELGEL